MYWRIMQFFLPEQSGTTTCQYACIITPQVLLVNVSRPYFSTRSQDAREKLVSGDNTRSNPGPDCNPVYFFVDLHQASCITSLTNPHSQTKDQTFSHFRPLQINFLFPVHRPHPQSWKSVRPHYSFNDITDPVYSRYLTTFSGQTADMLLSVMIYTPLLQNAAAVDHLWALRRQDVSPWIHYCKLCGCTLHWSTC